MILYDSDVLHAFAADLNARADRAIGTWAVMVGLLGFVAGAAMSGGSSDTLLMYGLGGALVGALLGGMLGRAKALDLRVAAQTLLCQVQIEENTRRAASVVPEPQRSTFGAGVRPPRLSPDR